MSRKRITSRKHDNLQIKPLVIVIGEGNTEEGYVNKVKTFSLFEKIRIKFIVGNEQNFETILQEHLDIIDDILVILDLDNIQKGTKRYDKILALLLKYPYQVFYNNYSFEAWLLNHVDVFAKPINAASEYDPFFKFHFSIDTWHKYKNEQNLNKVLAVVDETSTKNAIKNISVISKKDWDNNPSSNMDKFIETIVEKTT